MKHTYDIDTEARIISRIYEGIVTIYDLKDGYRQVLSDDRFDPYYDILVDFRKCQLLIDIDEIKSYVEIIEKDVIDHKVKAAFIVDTPIETALTMIYQDMAESMRRANVFSTYEAAMEWLNLK